MGKFKAADRYLPIGPLRYDLLPFRFTELSAGNYVATNEAGESIVLSREELFAFARHELTERNDLYYLLKSKHFLIDGDSGVAIDLLALKKRTKLSRLSDFTGLHIFVATLRCEHSCPYCQVSRKNDGRSGFDMSEETAENALRMAFRSPSKVLKIEFQGGETLLNFDLIRFVVDRAREMNKKEQRVLQFVTATNLAVVDDRMLEYFAENEILVSTSLDGPADLHNRNRPRKGGDSHERAVEGIERARRMVGWDRVGALMTTTEASLGRVREIVDEYVRLDFEGIFLRPLSPYGFAVKTKSYDAYDSSRWLDFYFEGLDYIVEINLAGKFFVEQYAALILQKMLSPFEPGYVDLRSPAGIGVAALVYNYDGDVYASDESRMLAEMGDKTFRLGNVNANSWEEIVGSEILLDSLERSFAGSAPMCSECAFEPFCGSEPVFHHATQGDVVGHKPTSEFCSRNMAIFRRLFEMMRGDEKVKSVLESWVRF